MHKLHYERNRAHKKLKWLNLIVTQSLQLRRGHRHRIATVGLLSGWAIIIVQTTNSIEVFFTRRNRRRFTPMRVSYCARIAWKISQHLFFDPLSLLSCLAQFASDNQTYKRVLLPISSSNELALDEKKEIVFSRSLPIVRLFCGVLRTSSSSADGLPTPSLSLPGTAIASSRFANMRDWLRRLLLPRSCCEEFAQGFRFR